MNKPDLVFVTNDNREKLRPIIDAYAHEKKDAEIKNRRARNGEVLKEASEVPTGIEDNCYKEFREGFDAIKEQMTEEMKNETA